MIVRALRGRVTDVEAGRAMLERWEHEVAPNAVGLLGATAGVTDDGWLLQVARFESPADADATNASPELKAWSADATKLFDGPATRYECPTVDAHIGKDCDQACFVQVTTCRVSDVAAAREFGGKFAEIAGAVRPDLLGFVDSFTSDGQCVTTSYFPSEDAAREGEQAEMPPEHQEVFQGFRSLVSDFEYFDLRNPRLFSAS